MAALNRLAAQAFLLLLLAGPAAAGEFAEIAAALREDRTDTTTWSRAMELRRQVFDDLDVENGRLLLTTLAEVHHEKELFYRSDLGWLYLDSGRLDEAAGVFESMLAEHPEAKPALYGLADVADRRGDHREAVGHFERLIELGDGYWPHRERARRLAVFLGDFAGAEKSLDVAHQLAREIEDPEAQKVALLKIEEVRVWVEEQLDRRAALDALSGRQDGLLLAIGVGWALLLAVGYVVLRRL